jgi:hypothetical protein
MTNKSVFLVFALAFLAIAGVIHYAFPRPEPEHRHADAQVLIAAPGKTVESVHYSITSTATDQQTRLVAKAADSLFDAYLVFFAKSLDVQPHQQRLHLTLYRNQGEFKRNNKSSPWAEAYYLPPNCYAYYGEGEQNPYHWMLHEATHQLNREVAHLKKNKWADEGLATYFGTSKIEQGVLMPGSIDVNTYPIWWLSKLSLSGNLDEDMAAGKLISLRALISGVGGPDIARNVNAYYIGYWSLTHFLFHYQNGRYASKYRQLIAKGGALEDFEREIGPVDGIQDEWYGYLREQVGTIQDGEVVYVIEN